MKNPIYSFLILYLFLLAACKKGDPEIAPNNQLSVLSFSESFICQPLAFTDHMVALVTDNNLTSLISFSEQGNKLWQKSVDQYIIPGANYNDLKSLSIKKATNGEIILDMYHPVLDLAQQVKNQVTKLIDFDANGNFKWQMTDSIHQPDTIVIGLDTIDIKLIFKNAGMVHLSTGNHLIISSQIDSNLGCTYLQLSMYDNNGVFINDRYLRILGSREIEKVFLTSNDELIIYNRIQPKGQSYILMDLTGNVKFEKVPPEPIVENYFLHECKSGIFIISASYDDKTGGFRGIVFTLDKNGNLSWSGSSSSAPNWIMTSVQEKTDSYLYSGFTTISTLIPSIDWRTTFLQNENQAVIQKTDLNRKEIWHQILTGMPNSAGAATIGTDQIGFFSEKSDNSVETIVLLKLDTEGIILNK